VRKLKELLITRRLEAALSKRRILEIYLNVIEWGDGIFGAEAAARAYFGKSAAALSAEGARSSIRASTVLRIRLGGYCAGSRSSQSGWVSNPHRLRRPQRRSSSTPQQQRRHNQVTPRSGFRQ
jgi:monofunctional biosynthetic peptidoglycan transglycosylase